MSDMQWSSNLITAISTITASALAFYSAIRINKNNLLQEKEKVELSYQREDKIQKFIIYNKVLKYDGEHLVVKNDDEENDDQTSFDIFYYKTYTRNVLYEKLHLLDQDIRDIVLSIDEEILIIELNPDDYVAILERTNNLVKLYVSLISHVTHHYKKEIFNIE
ncbi:hypothetical protein [Paenibacillus sp. 7523-1]|uniref:hypothetical protein n=1 Tax=Paenibacillus sp. 7523-1 TaxID=2022550 RepID=UPI000BA60C7F|nr:hypothetical protein [Paenibacillus sp. 7523-1]PAD30044.1 hypothetical protein CHH60_18090 [Paenibacillus sp. 7523-1]